MTAFTLSNHSLAMLLGCQRRGFYYKIRGRVRAVEEAREGADAGAAVHRALARLGLGQPLDNALAAVDTHATTSEDYRTAAYLREAVRAYHQHWGDEARLYRVKAVEMPFHLDLGYASEIKVNWEGRIDSVVAHPDGRLLVRDIKTMARWADTKLDEFEANPALPGYVWAAGALLGAPLAGAQLDAVVMRPPTKAERTTLPRFEFHRAVFAVDAEQIAEWQANTLDAVAQFLTAVAAERTVMNRNECVNAFGRRCPYWDVCALPPSQRDLMLSTDMYTNYTPRVAAED